MERDDLITCEPVGNTVVSNLTNERLMQNKKETKKKKKKKKKQRHPIFCQGCYTIFERMRDDLLYMIMLTNPILHSFRAMSSSFIIKDTNRIA